MKNKLICGDNLEVLKSIGSESVDLIYIGPPFFTHKQYEVIWSRLIYLWHFRIYKRR
ncbi:hypothetical protein ES705_22063 [subsurface metagenome]